MGKDPPIIEQEFLAGVRVIDIGDIRVSRGLSRRPLSVCNHKKLTYDPNERRIWCKDCETNVDAFDAFKGIAEQFYAAQKLIDKRAEAIKSAEEHALHLIAAKNVEAIWRSKKMIPTCPHCRSGLLPEDFNPVGLRISAEIERQKRKKKQRRTEG